MTGLWDNAVVHDVSGRAAPHRGAPEAPGSVRAKPHFMSSVSAKAMGAIEKKRRPGASPLEKAARVHSSPRKSRTVRIP
jgi:hypothetical protein